MFNNFSGKHPGSHKTSCGGKSIPVRDFRISKVYQNKCNDTKENCCCHSKIKESSKSYVGYFKVIFFCAFASKHPEIPTINTNDQVVNLQAHVGIEFSNKKDVNI